MKINIKTIETYLVQNKIEVKRQEETDQLYFLLSLQGKEVPVFIKIFPGELMVQLISFLPFQVSPEAFGDLSRLLHFLNRETDAPGFGLDEESKLVFYRLMVPTLNSELNESLFNMYLNTLQNICNEFILNIEPVASGRVSFDEVLKQARKT